MSSVGTASALGPVAGYVTGSTSSTAALQGQIQRDRIALNDWVTCVSASTPKGQAAIQSLSAQISAANERLRQTQALKSPGAQVQTTHAGTTTSTNGGASAGRINTWA